MAVALYTGEDITVVIDLVDDDFSLMADVIVGVIINVLVSQKDAPLKSLAPLPKHGRQERYQWKLQRFSQIQITPITST